MLKVDLHIHSIHSGHAYGSFYDIVNEAKSKRMKIIAITDHGPKMSGSASNLHFGMRFRLPKHSSLKILWGCEANILDAKGTIDVEPYLLDDLDLVLVGFHQNCGYKDLGIKKNTLAVKRALKNPKVKILTHPTNPQYVYDMDEVMNFALDNGVLLELNLAYLKLRGDKELSLFKKIIDISRAHKQKIIVDSDAHFIHEIGDDAVLKKYWKALGLTDDIIFNNYPDELMKFLGIKV